MNTLRLILVLCIVYGTIYVWQSSRPSSAAFHLSQSHAVSTTPPPQKFDAVISLDTTFHYPHAQILQGDSTHLTQISSDEARLIFEWYKKQFVKESLELSNFSQSNRNGLKTYQATGTRSDLSIILSIRKDSLDSSTFIDISEKSRNNP